MILKALGRRVGACLIAASFFDGDGLARAQSQVVPPSSPDTGVTGEPPPPPPPPLDPNAPNAPNTVSPAPPVAPVVLPEGITTTPVEAPPAKEGKGKKKKKKDDTGDVVPSDHVASSWGNFRVKGRLFARIELSQRDPSTQTFNTETLDIEVPSARISLRYQAPVEWLTAELEIDIAGKPDMKDGYINARGEHLSARFGQFKLPSAAIEMESPWTLPLIRRGLISDLIVDRLDIAGRRPGLMAGWRAKGLLKPRISVGAFQGMVVTEEGLGYREVDLISTDTRGVQGLESQSVAARAQIEVGPVQIGGYYQHRLGSPAFRTAHYWTAGGDVTVDWVFGHGGLRVWLDGMAGASWYENRAKPADGADATFASARALLAYRIGGLSDDTPYFEVYALAGGLDPDLDLTADLAMEGVLGITAGLWNRARLSLQGEIEQAGRNFPETYFLGLNPNRRGILLQGGITF